MPNVKFARRFSETPYMALPLEDAMFRYAVVKKTLVETVGSNKVFHREEIKDFDNVNSALYYADSLNKGETENNVTYAVVDRVNGNYVEKDTTIQGDVH